MPAPALCEVQCYVQKNGRPVEGATVRAKVNSSNSAAGGTIVSTLWDSTKTDILGYGTLGLIRASEFTDGDGQYTIEAYIGGNLIWTVTTTIPDVASVNLEDLI